MSSLGLEPDFWSHYRHFQTNFSEWRELQSQGLLEKHLNKSLLSTRDIIKTIRLNYYNGNKRGSASNMSTVQCVPNEFLSKDSASSSETLYCSMDDYSAGNCPVQMELTLSELGSLYNGRCHTVEVARPVLEGHGGHSFQRSSHLDIMLRDPWTKQGEVSVYCTYVVFESSTVLRM